MQRALRGAGLVQIPHGRVRRSVSVFFFLVHSPWAVSGGAVGLVSKGIGKRRMLAVCVALSVFVPGPGGAYHSPEDPVDRTVVNLPEAGFDVVTDSSDGRIYVAGNSGVRVYDFEGASLGTVTGQAGAVRLALDAATGTLYVALRDDAAVSAIDTTTLQERTRWVLGEGQSPRFLALGAGRLWVGAVGYEEAQPGGRVLSLDPTDPESAVREDAEGFYGPPQIAYGGGTLAATNTWSEPPTMKIYDVTGESPVLLSSKWNPSSDGRAASQLLVSDDGEKIFWAGGPVGVRVLAVEDLSITKTFDAGGYVTSVQLSSDENTVVVGGAAEDTAESYGESIRVYRADDSAPHRATRTPFVGRLSLSADGLTLAALSGSALHIFSEPFTPSSVLDGHLLNHVQQWWRGETVVVAGTLRTRHGEGLAGRVVTLSPSHTSPYPRQTAVTGPDGKFEFRFAGEHLGWHDLFMSYDGEPGLLGTTRRGLISVRKRPSSLTLTRPQVVQVGDTVTVSASMVTPASGMIELSIQPHGKPRQVLNTAVVAPGRKLSATYTAATNTKVTARFLGDYHYATSRRSGTVLAAPRMHARLSGYDDTILTRNRRIRIFNNGRTLRLHGAVVPEHQASCYTGMLQRRSSSGWVDVSNWCAVLDDDGRTITVPPVILKSSYYRIKAVHAADEDHARGVSPTRFFRVR